MTSLTVCRGRYPRQLRKLGTLELPKTDMVHTNVQVFPFAFLGQPGA